MSFEILGPGGYGSINYERNFNRKENRFMTFRAGLGLTDVLLLGVPHGLTMSFGRKNYFETGVLANLGYSTFGFVDGPASFYFLGPTIGYRRQAPGKWFFRVFANLAITVQRYPEAYAGGGLGIGFPFRKT